MPNATVRANARSTPKPKPASRESIRRQVEDIEKAKSLLEAVDIRSSPDALKDVRALVERLEGELRLGGPKRADPSPAEAAVRDDSDIEEKIHHVRVWASIVWELWNEGSWRDDEMLGRERIDHVLDQVHDAAEELYRAYHGDPEAEEAEIAR
jgi:hypothetical protein